ncbi:MAG: NTP transferase domain-containing protein [Phycisphaerales bacterium]|nr:NTP transferase domain-containing protein [Phycisphaerales bacterium]
MEYGLIMAGGSGTRLWPLSRGGKPKQLLPIVRGKSLLRLSFERLLDVFPPERIYICTGASFADDILAEVPEMPRENLLGEPEGRDTANAVGFPAAVLHKRDPEAVMAIVTADHVIEPVDIFRDAIRVALDVTRSLPNALVTFGIVPTHGHTGLGYIHRGQPLGQKHAYRVQAFKEKPDKPTADRYVESGRYYWNSGMFVWRADTVLSELKAFLPKAHAGWMKIADAWGTPRQQQVLQEVYPALQRISIDYALMEPASQGAGSGQVATVEMPVQWLDVGSWPALADVLETDHADNAVDAPACLLLDSDNNVVVSRNSQHLIATIGLSDTIIVHTNDATLICPKSEAERVKELVGKIKEQFDGQYD